MRYNATYFTILNIKYKNRIQLPKENKYKSNMSQFSC